MEKCCSSHQTPRSQRRLNGLQLPLNYQQVIGWVVFLVTALLNFLILVEIQFQELKTASVITLVLLYVAHVGSHVTASMTDPSEKELRKLKLDNVPEFDRSVHAHVIENGRCHLCNIYTSSRKTKHCSICNKCIDHFDHHCKWLNNCVGQRNYAAFITCVATALLISIFTTSLCITDIVLFLAYPQQLSLKAQNFISCNSTEKPNSNKYCQNSISFLTFLIIFCASAVAISCALLHLCCFHVYISVLEVTTYEYIVKSGTLSASQPRCFRKRSVKCPSNVQENRRHKEQCSRYRADSIESGDEASTPQTQIQKPEQPHGETKVTNLINILISNELDRAKKIFFYNKNKIHPQNETTTTASS